MSDEPSAERGETVTYLDAADPENAEFRQALVVGDGMADPETDTVWVPVASPDRELTLIDPALIVPGVEVPPDTEPLAGDQPLGALHVFGAALATLACGMSALDERAPMALPAARALLTRFVDAITRVDDALRALVAVDPRGGLAAVLSCLSSAADEFERGSVEYGRAGILLANRTMVELLPPEQEEL
jgi:hypothetical protein